VHPDRPTLPEVRRYTSNVFDRGWIETGIALPLDDEPFVACWQRWVEEAAKSSAWEVLSAALPQLRFPIRRGISETESYRAATRQGRPPEDLAEEAGLGLERPQELEISLHATGAGRIPVLAVRHRPDFERLVQALTRRNEPVPVPPAQGAAMVAGYVNWTRVREARQRLGRPLGPEDKPLYQDRFILLSDGPYSGVPAVVLGLDEGPWRETSLALRRDHESAHYLTRRLLGSMRNHLHDELIADYAGMAGATGAFRAGWLRAFLGLGSPDGRVHIYRGDPPLPDAAFAVVQEMVERAAEQVESFDEGRRGARSLRERTLAVLALAVLRLDEIARPDGAQRLEETCSAVAAAVRWQAAEP
jgi:hypothetical protein